MKQLAAIEYAKLKKLNSLKVILLVYMAVGPIWMILYSLLTSMNQGLMMILGSTDKMFSFPHVWTYTAWSFGFFNILLGVAVVIITCNEIQFKTMRQNVIDGLSKKEVIISKFITIFMLSTFVAIYTAIVAFIFGVCYSGFDQVFENIHYIFVYYLQTLGYFSVAFLLASIIRKPALSIILFIFIYPVEGIASLFVPRNVSAFMPLRSMSRLIPSPFETIEVMLAEKQTGIDIWITPVWVYVLTASLYIILMFSFTYFLLRRRDL